MPYTPLMNLPIPAEGEDPFITSIEAFQAAVDSWIQQANEDLELLWYMDGAPWTYDDVTFTLSWAGPIMVFSPRTAGTIMIPPGSVVGASAAHVLASIQVPTRPIAGSPVCAVVLDEVKPLDANRIFLGVAVYPSMVRARRPLVVSDPDVLPAVVNLPGGAYAVGETSPAHGLTFHSVLAGSPSAITLAAVFDTEGARVTFARLADDPEQEIVIRPRAGGWPFDHSIRYAGNKQITPAGALVIAGRNSGVELRLLNRFLCDTWIVTAVWGDVIDHNGDPVRLVKNHMPRAFVAGGSTVPGPEVDAGGAGAAGAWTPRTLANGVGELPIEVLQHPIVAVDPVGGWFEVPGDQSRFYPLGKRFRVMWSTGNDTGDAEHITASAVYSAGPDTTRITIATAGVAPYLRTTIASPVADGSLFPGWFGLAATLQADPDYQIKALVRLATTGCGCGRFQARIMVAEFGGGPCPMTFWPVDGQWTGGGWIAGSTQMGRSPVGAPQEVVTGEALIGFSGGLDAWLLVVQYNELVGPGPTWPEWGELAPPGSGISDNRLTVTLSELAGK